MKKNHNHLLSVTAALLMTILSLSAQAELKGPPEGRQQLVDALDAGWVRALDDGEIRAIINRYDMADLVINMADCLPDPHVTRFPENPTGTLKRILDEGRITVGYTNTGKLDEYSTAVHFTGMGDDMIAAVLARMAAHYGSKPIEMETVVIPPPFLNTKYLDSGEADILGQVNALGGSTKDDERRRTARRYTCTMTATRQFVWMLKDGGPGWQTIDDALNAKDVHFCAGPLANELTNTYFDQPGQSVKTEFVSDLGKCLPKLVSGEAAAMINPLPNESYFPERIDTDGDGKPDTATKGLFRAIDTNIVAGTPLWVAID
ncbi:MAG: hypothetical protein ACR2P6_04215 [Gammaproteobacteria bacterium]